MLMTTTCDHCQFQFTIPEDVVGRTLCCPTCQGYFTAAADADLDDVQDQRPAQRRRKPENRSWAAVNKGLQTIFFSVLVGFCLGFAGLNAMYLTGTFGDRQFPLLRGKDETLMT